MKAEAVPTLFSERSTMTPAKNKWNTRLNKIRQLSYMKAETSTSSLVSTTCTCQCTKMQMKDAETQTDLFDVNLPGSQDIVKLQVEDL